MAYSEERELNGFRRCEANNDRALVPVHDLGACFSVVAEPSRNHARTVSCLHVISIFLSHVKFQILAEHQVPLAGLPSTEGLFYGESTCGPQFDRYD